MSFSVKQVDAVRHTFHLANFDGELRTLPVEFDHERIFIVPAGAELTMGDPHCLEIVLGTLLDRTVLVTGDVGAPTVGVRVTAEVYPRRKAVEFRFKV